MNAARSIADLIAAHRAAVAADEASFTEDGEPIEVMAAEATAAVELEAFRQLMFAPCTSSADIQAKLDYLLNGSVGMRDTLITCLQFDYGDDLVPALLKSMLAPAETV